MRRLVFATIVCCLVASVIVSGEDERQAADEIRKADLRDSIGASRDGLAAYLAAPRGTAFHQGDAIPVLVGIMRTRDDRHTEHVRPVWPILYAGYPGDFAWFTVTGPDGKAIPFSGPIYDRPNPPVPAHRMVSLRVNDMLARAVCIEGFDFGTPGTYLVRWHYRGNSAHGGWDGEIESNELRIEIE